MKILYITMRFNYLSKGLYVDMIDSLINRKHEVTVVKSDYNIEKDSYEKINENLNILSVKTFNPFSKNLIKKGLAQVSLDKLFKKSIDKHLTSEEFDLILYATPPITLSGVISYCKKKYNAKTFLMLKDIFPQNAIDLGMMKEGSLIHKYFRRFPYCFA